MSSTKTAQIGPSHDLSPININKFDKNEIRSRIKELGKALKNDQEFSEPNSHARGVLLHRKKLLESKLDSIIRHEWQTSQENLSPSTAAILNAVNLFYKFAMGPEGPKCQVCGDRYEYADPNDPYCYRHCKPQKIEENIPSPEKGDDPIISPFIDKAPGYSRRKNQIKKLDYYINEVDYSDFDGWELGEELVRDGCGTEFIANHPELSDDEIDELISKCKRIYKEKNEMGGY